jgi:hypothetical protein
MMTIPEKPNSRLQKYQLTEKGRAWLPKTKANANPASPIWKTDVDYP